MSCAIDIGYDTVIFSGSIAIHEVMIETPPKLTCAFFVESQELGRGLWSSVV